MKIEIKLPKSTLKTEFITHWPLDSRKAEYILKVQ